MQYAKVVQDSDRLISYNGGSELQIFKAVLANILAHLMYIRVN